MRRPLVVRVVSFVAVFTAWELYGRSVNPILFTYPTAIARAFVELTAKGVPFRDAYRQVARELASLESGDAAASLAARTSPGATGDLRLDAIAARLGIAGVSRP